MNGESESQSGIPVTIAWLLLSASPFLVVSISTLTTWLYLVAWVLIGGVRSVRGDNDIRTDCAIFLTADALVLREGLLSTLKELDLRSLAQGWKVTIQLLSLVPLALVLSQLYKQKRGTTHIVQRSATSPRTAIAASKPQSTSLIFPCRTSHVRLFPKKHGFDYSYLLLGLPIHEAAAQDTKLGKWWMQVRAADYLTRGAGSSGFYNKLRDTLRGQGVQDTEWSYAYLVTAPRFLGYSFNPVSFWYIYDRRHELVKMILEVNNTFGERRIYLLDGSCPASPPKLSSVVEEQEIDAKKKFTDVWMKDFHVSPFNSRKGSYALRAIDPFAEHPDLAEEGLEMVKIDNTITLKSSKDYGKLVARIYSTGTPSPAENLGLWGTIRFIASWWWVGLVTFPRILREAVKLYFKRGLHVWFRPEILASSIGRLPSNDEMYVLSCFTSFEVSLMIAVS